MSMLLTHAACQEFKKTCTKCNKTKLISEFHTDRISNDGKHRWCKTCNVASNAAWRISERTRIKTNIVCLKEHPAKTCEKCGESKPAEAFEFRRKTNGKMAGICDACKIQIAKDRTSSRVRKWRLAEENLEKDRAKVRLWNSINTDKRRGHKIKRKMLLAGAKQEPYKAKEIFERDGWICHICKSEVDKTLKYPHLFSASIDHVMPLSAGGDDTPSNVACSHLRCNISKNDTIIDRDTRQESPHDDEANPDIPGRSRQPRRLRPALAA